MTGECSSASLAGSRPVICQLSPLSAGNDLILTWIRKFVKIWIQLLVFILLRLNL